jgi:mono/diheme cytochrome c family protein
VALNVFNDFRIIKDMTMKVSLISILALFLLVACDGTTKFKESKTFAGGKVVDPGTLALGQTTYLEYCIQCHGADGKGKGPSSEGLLPPPRDLTQGLYKFPWVAYGEVPHDEDFARIIRHGLKGSAMLPWDISDERLDAVIQYIKTFAPQVWEVKDAQLGAKLDLPADPFGDTYRHQAIEKGKKVYHITAACTQCHRGYATKDEITQWNKEMGGSVEIDTAFYQLKSQDSEYNYKALPPDFTYHELRSITDVPSIVQRLMYGVTGSGMPGWKDVVTDEELWALSYYVQSLRELKGDMPKRNELINRVTNK